MKHHDLLKECPKDKLEMLYKGVGAWGDWFMNYKVMTATVCPRWSTVMNSA
jgi:hypothetical protein